MKRSSGGFFWFAGLLLTLVLAQGAAQSQEPAEDQGEPYDRVYVSRDLRDFSRALYDPEGSEFSIDPQGRYLIMGTVSTVTVIDPAPESYYTEVEIIQAERTPDNELERFDGIIAVFDSRFMDLIPQRAPMNPGPELIVPNRKGLFLVEYYRPYEMGGGVLIPVFVLLEYQGL